MKRFREYMTESKGIGSIENLKRVIDNNDKVYILFAGTLGAGKSYFAKMHLPHVKVIDPDEIAVAMVGVDKAREAGAKAMAAKQQAVADALETEQKFAEMGTSGNTQAALNKLERAKKAGFVTVFVFISTDPETAKERNRFRIAGGDRGVPPEKEWKIDVMHDKAMATAKEVQKFKDLDYFFAVRT